MPKDDNCNIQWKELLDFLDFQTRPVFNLTDADYQKVVRHAPPVKDIEVGILCINVNQCYLHWILFFYVPMHTIINTNQRIGSSDYWKIDYVLFELSSDEARYLVNSASVSLYLYLYNLAVAFPSLPCSRVRSYPCSYGWRP